MFPFPGKGTDSLVDTGIVLCEVSDMAEYYQIDDGGGGEWKGFRTTLIDMFHGRSHKCEVIVLSRGSLREMHLSRIVRPGKAFLWLD